MNWERELTDLELTTSQSRPLGTQFRYLRTEPNDQRQTADPFWSKFDGSSFDHDAGEWAFARYGTRMPAGEVWWAPLGPLLPIGWRHPFTSLTPEPYDQSLFLVKNTSSASEFIDVLSEGVWHPDNRSVCFPLLSSYPELGGVDLFRKHVFEPSNLEFVAGRNGSVEGARKLVVVIHGWNPDSLEDSMASTNSSGNQTVWGRLRQGLSSKVAAIQGQMDWRVAEYHWEQSADTGPVVGVSPSISARNATPSAEAAHMHGWYLGELLEHYTTDELGGGSLDTIHFIAHSAGSWAARSAAYYITNVYNELKPARKLKVQVTLLDAYIPGNANALFPFDSALDGELMSKLHDQLSLPARSLHLENYFSRGDLNSGLMVLGTQEVLGKWEVEGESVNYDMERNGFFGWIPDALAHDDPVGWYADTTNTPDIDPEFDLPWSGDREGEGFNESYLYEDWIKYRDLDRYGEDPYSFEGSVFQIVKASGEVAYVKVARDGADSFTTMEIDEQGIPIGQIPFLKISEEAGIQIFSDIQEFILAERGGDMSLSILPGRLVGMDLIDGLSPIRFLKDRLSDFNLTEFLHQSAHDEAERETGADYSHWPLKEAVDLLDVEAVSSERFKFSVYQHHGLNSDWVAVEFNHDESELDKDYPYLRVALAFDGSPFVLKWNRFPEGDAVVQFVRLPAGTLAGAGSAVMEVVPKDYCINPFTHFVCELDKGRYSNRASGIPDALVEESSEGRLFYSSLPPEGLAQSLRLDELVGESVSSGVVERGTESMLMMDDAGLEQPLGLPASLSSVERIVCAPE